MTSNLLEMARRLNLPLHYFMDLDAAHTPVPDLTEYLVPRTQYREPGSLSDVYRCQLTSGKKTQEVAVKAFRFRFLAKGEGAAEFLKLFQRELNTWRRMNHSNIVPFFGIAHGFGLVGSVSWVTLWMSNGSLRTFLAKHDSELAIPHRLKLLLDIANGLHFLHSLNMPPIVHGELNPNNVLLDGHFTALLTDFACTSLVEESHEGLRFLQEASGLRMESVRWTTPEHSQDDPKTTKSDIYSFGSLGLQVLSGKPPWSEIRSNFTILTRIAKGQQPGRPISRPIEDQHWEFLERCWSLPEGRPAAGQVVMAMQRFLDSCPPSPPLSELLVSAAVQRRPPPPEFSMEWDCLRLFSWAWNAGGG